MFFQGTLQEGISSALQQSKFVVCFVTDDQTESQLWESEFLADESLKTLLQDRAVSLRLQAGSIEAGYLAAIFPLPKTPTLVIIKNGELREYIAPGVSKEDFGTRTRNALGLTGDPLNQTSSVAGATSAQEQSTSQPTGNVSTESSGQATPSSATEPESSDVQALLAERGVKLEAQRKKAAEEARARAKAKAEAKAAEAKKTGVPDPQSKHADMLKKKRKDAQEEKRRILQAIEDDKVARKARQAEREAERRMALEIQKEEEASLRESVVATSMVPPTSRFSEICALQVRLFDGSTIRNCFPSGSNLGTDVRNWVDANRGSDKQAYTFKVVLTPLPNKNIETSEESQSLQDLGLTRSSTLVLVPAAKSTAEAYPGNPVSRLIAFVLACIAGFFTGIVNFFATLFSTSGPSGQEPGRPAAGRGQGAASGLDESRRQEIRDRRNNQQFYNGNSTNFEPRRDDEDE